MPIDSERMRSHTHKSHPSSSRWKTHSTIAWCCSWPSLQWSASSLVWLYIQQLAGLRVSSSSLLSSSRSSSQPTMITRRTRSLLSFRTLIATRIYPWLVASAPRCRVSPCGTSSSATSFISQLATKCLPTASWFPPHLSKLTSQSVSS